MLPPIPQPAPPSLTSPDVPLDTDEAPVRRAVVAGVGGDDEAGLHLLQRNAGTWQEVASAGEATSWLVPTGTGRLLAIEEQTPSRVRAVQVSGPEAQPAITAGDPLSLSGSGACHAAVSGDWLVVAHYGSGSVSSVRLDAGGTPVAEVDHLTLVGSGPVADRQEHPHAHQVVVHGSQVLVCDLGSDRVHRLALDPQGRLLEAAPALQLPPGFGPRHLVLVEDLVVVAGELSCQLWAGPLDAAPGQGQLLPLGKQGSDWPSGIRVDSDGLIWTAVRGSDVVWAHRVVAGRLEPVTSVAATGVWPRDLVVSSREIWICHERADAVTVLDRTQLVGESTQFPVLADIPVPAPMCVVLAP